MNDFPVEITAYQPIVRCGRGAYGTVWLVKDGLGNRCALKIVEKGSLGDFWERELSGLKTYRQCIDRTKPHPHLIAIHHVEIFDSFFYYTMDCADDAGGGDGGYVPDTLAERIRRNGPLPWLDILEIFSAMLDALDELHRAGVVHRDIKPDNIIFVAGVPKLGDIGLIGSLSRTLSIIGTTAFVPPEILTGQKKTPDRGCDLYALGKTLYCAFSGNDAGEFPLVPPEVLRHPCGRRFNKLVKRCCAETPGMRIRTTDEFRQLLYGRSAWQYDWRRLLNWALWALLLPPRLVALGWRFWYCRLLVGLLFFAWLSAVAVRYAWLRQHEYVDRHVLLLHWPLLKRSLLEWYLPWYLPLAGYDAYDFVKKDERTVKHFGEHWWVSRQSYLRSKNPRIPEDIHATVEIGDPDEEGSVKAVTRLSFVDPRIEQSTPLGDEFLHELVFSGLDDPKLQAAGEVEWRDGVMILPASRHGRLKYTKELPLRSDIQISLDTEGFSGRIEFILTTADYIPPHGQKTPPDILIKRQVRFALNSDGRELTFADAIYRPQDASEEDVVRFGAPKVESLPATGGFRRFRIVSVTGGVRVYCDDKLIWGTHLAFYGGYFELRCSGTGLRVGEFSIYDAKLVQPGETRTSRLRIP